MEPSFELPELILTIPIIITTSLTKVAALMYTAFTTLERTDCMPRGVKGTGTPRKPKKTIDEKVSDIDVAIEGLKAKIAELNKEKKSLLETRETEKTTELLKVINDSGMSASDLLALVKKEGK
jgi:hypothetical protein